MSIKIPDAMDVLAKLRRDAQSPEAQAALAFAIDAFLFIASSGQRYAFEDFRETLNQLAPPPVVAAFDTRAEADAWLRDHPEPPDSTFVLIANEYHLLLYRRETNLRRFLPDPVIEYYLGRLERLGPPAAVAAFETREEAEAWLAAQHPPPEQCTLSIAGERYLAVFYRGLGRRALFPYRMAVVLEDRG